ncbi:DsbA family protein [Salmonella enterica]|nr:DsbA family protein [Salmonella enterica]
MLKSVLRYEVILLFIMPVVFCQPAISNDKINSIHAQDRKHYIILPNKIPDVPLVLEFFSFYCAHCYQFEQNYNISKVIQSKLPEGVGIVKYHITSMGPLGRELTRAWAVALIMGVEDKIEPLLFDAIQNKKTVRTAADIRMVFIDAGITGTDYDAAWDSFAVKELTARQLQAFTEFKVSGVPVMYINGQYQINSQGMDATNVDSFILCYVETVKKLVDRTIKH